MTIVAPDKQSDLEAARQLLDRQQPLPILTTGEDRQARERDLDDQLTTLRREMERLGKIPRACWRPRRTGAAARVHPDRYWFGMVIAAINAIFVVGAMVASFSGQYAIAEKTHLPEYLWIMVPIALDAPIVTSAFTAAVFRARKQPWSARWNWAIVGFLTLISVTVQVTHVLDVSGWFRTYELSFPAWLGVGIMALMPILVLVLSENLARLLVRPLGEHRDPVKRVAKRKPRTRRT